MSTFFFVSFSSPSPLHGTKVLFLVLVDFLSFSFFFRFFGKHNCRRNISYTNYCVCGGVCVYLSNVRVCVSVVLAASAAINYNRAS